jgi:hypothetical protein
LEQVIQIIGAMLILAGFALAQFRVLDTTAYAYLVLNLIGGVVLGVSAVIEMQIGFIVLEVVWALVSAWGIVQRLRGRVSPQATH